MPLPLPNLDTRRWADLVDEGRALIPRYAPQWTDHNAHDPGITILELLAWLGEMDVYRTNQVSDRHIRKFLSLVAFPPMPPKAARAVLTFSGTGLAPTGSECTTADGMPFRTLRDLAVSPATLMAVQVDAGDGVIHNHTDEFREKLPIECLGHDPQTGSALYTGFDQLPAGPLSLYVWMQPGGGVVRIAWEAFIGGPQPWTQLSPGYDDTHSLTRAGSVELPLGAGLAAATLGEVAAPLFYLRCRVTDGAFDTTPLLIDVAANSVMAEQAVPARQTFAIAAGVVPQGPPPAAGSRHRLTRSWTMTVLSRR